MSTVTLRDVDNRDDDGTPFVLEGTLEQAIAYLDGPVRRDALNGSEYLVDNVIAMLQAGDFYGAANLGRMTLGIYLSQSGATS